MEEVVTAATFNENFKSFCHKQSQEVSLIEVVIPGKPIPYAAARKGQKGKWYNPRSSEQSRVKWLIKKQYRGDPIRRAVIVEYEFYMPIPVSWPQWKRKAAEDGLIPHEVKPDADNLCKFYGDCIKNLLIEDDSHIIKLIPEKLYGIEPKTIIRIILSNYAQ